MSRVEQNLDFIQNIESLDYIKVVDDELSYDDRYLLSIRGYWSYNTQKEIIKCIKNTFDNYLSDVKDLTTSELTKRKEKTQNCLDKLDKLDNDEFKQLFKFIQNKLNEINKIETQKKNASKLLVRLTSDSDIDPDAIANLSIEKPDDCNDPEGLLDYIVYYLSMLKEGMIDAWELIYRYPIKIYLAKITSLNLNLNLNRNLNLNLILILILNRIFQNHNQIKNLY